MKLEEYRLREAEIKKRAIQAAKGVFPNDRKILRRFPAFWSGVQTGLLSSGSASPVGFSGRDIEVFAAGRQWAMDTYAQGPMATTAVPPELEGLCRPAAVGQVGGFRPRDRVLGSWSGGRFVGRNEDDWPEVEGVTLAPVLQVVCSDLPFRPTELEDVAVFQLFGAWVDGEWEHVVRTFATDRGLRPLDPPAGKAWKVLPVRWEARERDAPVRWEMPEDLLEAWESVGHAQGTKVGGRPSSLHGVSFEPVVQIDPAVTEGLGSCAGMLFIGRIGDDWVVEREED